MGGGLPSIADIQLNQEIAECHFGSGSPHNCPPDEEPVQGAGYVHPCTKLGGFPRWVVNWLAEGEWSINRYAAPGLIQNNDTNECHQFLGDTLTMLEQSFGGTYELIIGNEPQRIPYFVNIEYEIAQPFGEFGDCFLIVKAKFDYDTEPQTSVVVDWDECMSANQPWLLPGALPFPVTEVPYQYTNSHPCWEDAGSPGSTWLAPWGPITADWQSGERYTMRDFAWDGSAGCSTFASTAGSYVAPYVGNEACLQQPDDPDYEFKDRTFTGFGQSIYEWRINLTASGITNLASLPATILNYGNIYGLTNGGTFYLAANVPVFLQNPTFNVYQPGSLVLTSQYMGDAVGECGDGTVINNDGMGGHVCDTVWPSNPCGAGNVQGSYGELQQDNLRWKTELAIDAVINTIALHDFSITLKPCV